MKSGIYWIRNKISNKIYIGSAKNLMGRKASHFSELRKNKHPNRHLQMSFNKYGEENLEFETLITCHPTMLLWYEQQFLDQLKPEYNLVLTAGNCLGFKHTEETRKKMSENGKKRKHTEETKKKMSLARKGKKISEEQKRILLKTNLGKSPSKEIREKLSKSLKGRIFSEEHKRKIGEANRKRHLSDETRKKISESNMGRKSPTEGKHLSDETKLKISKTQKNRWQSRKNLCP